MKLHIFDTCIFPIYRFYNFLIQINLQNLSHYVLQNINVEKVVIYYHNARSFLFFLLFYHLLIYYYFSFLNIFYYWYVLNNLSYWLFRLFIFILLLFILFNIIFLNLLSFTYCLIISMYVGYTSLLLIIWSFKDIWISLIFILFFISFIIDIEWHVLSIFQLPIYSI